MELTPKLLKEFCKKDNLYNTPHLNDRLYLHYKGFRDITCLEPYTGLKVLWLEGNGIGKIKGLEAQTEMRTLYLQENLIEKLENIEHMVSFSLLWVSVLSTIPSPSSTPYACKNT